MNVEDIILSEFSFGDLLLLREQFKDEMRRRRNMRNFLREAVHAHPVIAPVLRDIPSYEEWQQPRILENGARCLALPRLARKASLQTRLRYLASLFAQDWSHLFPGASDDEDARVFYVYAHIDPRKGAIPLSPIPAILAGPPFYIGKGTGRRAWDLKRNQGHAKYVEKLRRARVADKDIIQMVAWGLSEREALIVEAKLIYFFGSIYDEATTGFLVNLADHIRPHFVGTMKNMCSQKDYRQYHRLALAHLKQYGMFPIP